MPEPMVAIVVPEYICLEHEADRLLEVLRGHSIEATIEANYSPVDRVSIIVAHGEGLLNIGSEV